MLLEAVLASAGVRLRSVATAMGITIRSAALRGERVRRAGDAGAGPVGLVGIGALTITVELDTDADARALERLAELTERYCVVGQSLRTPPRFVVRRVPV